MLAQLCNSLGIGGLIITTGTSTDSSPWYTEHNLKAYNWANIFPNHLHTITSFYRKKILNEAFLNSPSFAVCVPCYATSERNDPVCAHANRFLHSNVIKPLQPSGSANRKCVHHPGSVGSVVDIRRRILLFCSKEDRRLRTQWAHVTINVGM